MKTEISNLKLFKVKINYNKKLHCRKTETEWN